MENKSVGIKEAKGILGELVLQAEFAGKTTVITRNSKAAARLVPIEHKVLDDKTKPSAENSK